MCGQLIELIGKVLHMYIRFYSKHVLFVYLKIVKFILFFKFLKELRFYRWNTQTNFEFTRLYISRLPYVQEPFVVGGRCRVVFGLTEVRWV